MISKDQLRDTLHDVDQYQSFCERFSDEQAVLMDGVHLLEKTQRLNDLLDGQGVSHAVQIREERSKPPENRICAPTLSNCYEQSRRGTDIRIVGPSQLEAYLSYLADRVKADFRPDDYFLLPEYFYADDDTYVPRD